MKMLQVDSHTSLRRVEYKVLKKCELALRTELIPNPRTPYQEQYNAGIESLIAKMLKEFEVDPKSAGENLGKLKTIATEFYMKDLGGCCEP